MEYFEELPPHCPPDGARRPNAETFYRLTDRFPPTEEDFYCPRRLFSERKFHNECVARAISLFSTIGGCRQVKKLPALKSKTVIIKIVLDETSGKIQKTRENSHYSWWRRRGFDPIPICEQVDHG